jgi:hypothetical protein
VLFRQYKQYLGATVYEHILFHMTCSIRVSVSLAAYTFDDFSMQEQGL